MNTNCLACKGRGRKASKIRNGNGQIFGPKFSVYLRNAAPSTPIKCGANDQHTKCTRKGKRKGREREKERRKNAGKKSKQEEQHIFFRFQVSCV